jgi:hypothetical protein
MTFAFAWRRCNAGGASCTAISGATSATYTVASGDANHTLRVAVTAKNRAGSAVATSAQTTLVPAPPPSSGQVALWHMDETSGSVMHDSVGGHDGTLSNVRLGVPGFTNTAFGFTTSSASVPSAAALNPGSRKRPGDAGLGSHPQGPVHDRRRRVQGRVPADGPGVVRLRRLERLERTDRRAGAQQRTLAQRVMHEDRDVDPARRRRADVLDDGRGRHDLQ